jgi:hypothetical protein
MRNFDKLALVDRIGRELQARMSYADIAAYLRASGVDTNKPTSGVNSKWVYTKDLLTDESADLILRIADELKIPHSYTVTATKDTVEATFWEPLHFRLFLCHLAVFKKKTAALQSALRRFGVSAFVAHVDIEPTREWQDEIEAGLWSMDALAAILMPGFKESNWTDQEVGIAAGRGILVIPIIRGLDPYGFIAKYQGFHAAGKTISEVADGVFEILAKSPKTRARMLTCLVDTTLHAAQEDDAVEKLRRLQAVPDLPTAYIERLREGATTSAVFAHAPALDALNKLLFAKGLQQVVRGESEAAALEDDIPF